MRWQPGKEQREAARRRHQALREWRGLPERPDPSHRQHSLADLVPQWLKKLGLERRVTEQELAARWREVVGEFAAQHSRPQRLRHGVLTVVVSQPAVLYSLDRSRQTVLEKIKERLPAVEVKNVRFQAG